MIRRLARLLDHYWLSFSVYIVVGGAAALVEWTVFFLAITYGRINYIVAAIIAFFVATFVNYLLSIRMNFRSREGRSTGGELLLVYLVSGVGLLINLAVTATAVEVFGLWVMLGKVGGTGVAFIWNFMARQFLVFDRAPRWSRPVLGPLVRAARKIRAQGER